MSTLSDGLEQMAKKIADDKERMVKVSEWIDGFHGKIVSFRTPTESFHVVFAKEKVSVRAGYYPSSEACYRGAETALQKVLTRELSAYDGVKSKQFVVWGNLNEATEFESLL